jgi:TetR/AcrR family transcriptional repressor of nem operon
MRDRILDAAESRARAAGYDGFSFRDLAADIGIKSASIHYHFPTKADLAEALVRRYTQRALHHLGEAETLTAREAVERVCRLFERALIDEDRMCLCGLFGAQRDGLPAPVARATGEFFRCLIGFLAPFVPHRPGGSSAESIIAALEGGLILARSLEDPQVFHQVVAAQIPAEH